MPNPSDLIFWAKRWRAAHHICKGHPWTGVPSIAMENYMIYLAEVFSYLAERKELKQNA